MAFEMICGQCRGNLLVEHFGVVVACPHCGAHLHIPAAPADSMPTATTPAPPQVTQPTPEPVTPSEPEPVAVEPPSPVSMTDDPVSEPAPPTEEMSAFTGEESEPPPSVEISVVSPVAISETATENVSEETPEPATGDGAFSLSALMSSSETAAPESQAVSAEPTTTPNEPVAPISTITEPMAAAEPVHEPETVTVTPIEMAPTGLSGLFGSEASSPPAETLATEKPPVMASETPIVLQVEMPHGMDSLPREDHSPASPANNDMLAVPFVSKPARTDHMTVSKSAFLLLLSYSSAITIGFLYLLYYGSANKNDYGLESLPDVVPLKKKTASISVYKETAEMPAGHDLKVGDSQQFGNIEVTVLKVTRGEIQFRHFSDASKSRLPSAPVLKLWLRFKNVSKDQEIAPLDDQLLFTRAGKDRFSYRSNQFVMRVEQKGNRDAKRIIAFDHIIGSGWDLANLPLDKPLQPGESRDYYVPTCENDLDMLTGELVWRVHIRKGYSSRGNGVTTLFEVRFNSDVISDEAA